MTLLQDVLAVLSGSLVGFSLGLIGGGGSVLAVPLLVYVVGVKSPHVAIGTSALAVAANAAINLYSHWRTGHVKVGCAITYALFGIAGAAIGSTVGKAIDGNHLLALFGVVMIVIAVSMVRRPPAAGHPEVKLNRGSAGHLVPRLGAAALATGFLSGFFGIGGGFLIVPGLVMATGMPLINAIASSLVSVTSFGATTAANYALSGLVDWWIVALLLAGGAVGGLAGTATARHLADKRRMLATAFAVIVGAVGVYVVWRGIGGDPRLIATLPPLHEIAVLAHTRARQHRPIPAAGTSHALHPRHRHRHSHHGRSGVHARLRRAARRGLGPPRETADRQLGRARPGGQRPGQAGEGPVEPGLRALKSARAVP